MSSLPFIWFGLVATSFHPNLSESKQKHHGSGWQQRHERSVVVLTNINGHTPSILPQDKDLGTSQVLMLNYGI